MPRKKIFNNLEEKQNELKERLRNEANDEDVIREHIIDLIKTNRIKRPKDRCPVCFAIHPEDIPEICWKNGIVNKVILYEFDKYLKDNKKGRIV